MVATVFRGSWTTLLLMFLLGWPSGLSGTKPKVGMQVILLGTGYPRPDPNRAGPATAVIVGHEVFIFDTGRCVTSRMASAHLQYKDLRAIFLTHLHSDHISGLPDLFTSTWIYGRSVPLEVYGPTGTRSMADGLIKFFTADIQIRRDLVDKLPAGGATIHVHEITEGVVYQDAEVRITAFDVDHRPVEPAFGYRIDTVDKSVVISGDTHPTENLIQYAKGADVLVQESYLPEYFDRENSPEVSARLKHYHTSAEEAGQIAQEAGVRVLVLTHLIPGDADKTFRKRAKKYFTGTIVVGRDLMRF